MRGVEANRAEDAADPLAQTDLAWDGRAHQPPMQRKIGPSATRAAAPLPPRSAGGVQGTGYSVIGEPSQVQLGEPYKQEDRPRPLRIDDLQDQGSPVPPPLPSQPQTETRTTSTSPPLHEKLALENKLATFEVVHRMNVPQSEGGEPWTVRVSIASTKLVPWKDGVRECCCCLSLLQATANISSRSFHSILHVQAGQNSSPLTVVDGALQITAMDRTSLVEAQEVTKWNETITLTDMHPSDVHIAREPGAHQLPDQDGPGPSIFTKNGCASQPFSFCLQVWLTPFSCFLWLRRIGWTADTFVRLDSYDRWPKGAAGGAHCSPDSRRVCAYAIFHAATQQRHSDSAPKRAACHHPDAVLLFTSVKSARYRQVAAALGRGHAEQITVEINLTNVSTLQAPQCISCQEHG